MDINDVNKGKNKYCGPAVVSALTGMNTDDAARLIRFHNGTRKVTGTTEQCLTLALRGCNIIPREVFKAVLEEDRPTLDQWLREHKDIRTQGKVFLVSANNHWFLISGNRYVCGKSRNVVSIRDEKVDRQAHVRKVIELIEAGDGIQIPYQQIERMKPQSLNNEQKKYRQKAKRLAKEHGIEIVEEIVTPEGEKIFGVWPPEWLFDEEIDDPRDPFVGERLESDWETIHSMVEHYVDFILQGVPPE